MLSRDLDVIGCDLTGAQRDHFRPVTEEDGGNRGNRHRQESADDAEQGSPEGDCEEDDCRVQAHRARLQDRLQDVALYLLNRDDEDEDEDGVGQPVGDQSDDHSERASGEGADDRDEACEERDHSKNRPQRNTEDDQADADEERVHG